jgi:NADPH:quinone reductase-like Zn-dependent oxidoreductase
MTVMVLTDHGGVDTLGYQKVSTPQPAPGQMLSSVDVLHKALNRIRKIVTLRF